jgi:hypothetical protein
MLIALCRFLGINVVPDHSKRNIFDPANIPRAKQRAFPGHQVRHQIRTHQQRGQEHEDELPQPGEFPQGLSPRSFGAGRRSPFARQMIPLAGGWTGASPWYFSPSDFSRAEEEEKRDD